MNRPGAFDAKEKVLPGAAAAITPTPVTTQTVTTQTDNNSNISTIISSNNNNNTMSYTDRLKSSIFGQMFEHMKSWEDRRYFITCFTTNCKSFETKKSNPHSGSVTRSLLSAVKICLN